MGAKATVEHGNSSPGPPDFGNLTPTLCEAPRLTCLRILMHVVVTLATGGAGSYTDRVDHTIGRA